MTRVLLQFDKSHEGASAKPRSAPAFLSVDDDNRQAVEVDVAQWKERRVNLWALDRRADELALTRSFALRLSWTPPAAAAVRLVQSELMLRCQRWSEFRGPHTDASFDRARAHHRREHNLSKALVAADYAHALDAWQWTLRLKPDASLAVQLAALFHDVERLESEAEVRREQHARDYAKFKAAHAAAGSKIARDLMAAADVPTVDAERAVELVQAHDHPRESRSSDAELQLLEDADALSFFSLNAFGFLNYFGSEHTHRKVRFTLSRMSESAASRLRDLYLPPFIADEVGSLLAPTRNSQNGRSDDDLERTQQCLPLGF